jgi:hypothetical protein
MKHPAYPRKALLALQEWKVRPSRKPLIIRGARQVGKSTLVTEFARSYPHHIVLNLERAADRALFQQHDGVKPLMDALLLRERKSPAGGPLLLFVDEIQESPEAIRLLRYFHEDMPELHVIAAGSLLEFALVDVKSFPVGRVEFLYMHPLNFEEFLLAMDHGAALTALRTVPPPPHAHAVLLDLFHRYAIIGGMPEVVSEYLAHGSVAQLPRTYAGIWDAYTADVEKYARTTTQQAVVRHIMASAPASLDQRIKYERFGHSNYRSREVGEAFRALDAAMVIQVIHPTTSLHPPVIADLRKAPRLQFLDTGLVHHALGLQGELIGMNDLADAYKGALIPHLIAQELMSLHEERRYKPHFWVREKHQAHAEVDLVLAHGGSLLPVEVKSGAVGKLRSLQQFVEASGSPYAVRMYAGAFSVERHATPQGTPYLLMNLPYYTGTQLPQYIEWFVREHAL